MEEYFEIIRAALAEARIKGEVYYEAHHIIPKSFGKQSSTVLLIPEEHYRVHEILAEYWRAHSVYGQKMLWAFHRLAYDGKRKLTEEQYGEARRILQPLWKQKKSGQHRQSLSQAMKGNTNNKSRVYKGMVSTMSPQGKKALAQIRKEEQIGKRGIQAKATKGTVVYEAQTGEVIQAENALLLSELINLPVSTISYRLRKAQKKFLKGFAIYYKEN